MKIITGEIKRGFAYIMCIIMVLVNSLAGIVARAETNNPETVEKNDFDFEYAICSMDSGFSLYCYRANIYGNLYSGGDINISGSEVNISERVDSIGVINANGWKIFLEEKNQNIEEKQFSEIGLAIKESVSDTVEQDNISISQDSVFVESNFVSKTGITIGCTSLYGSGIMVANDDISININSYRFDDTNNTKIIYSENGDIIISGNEVYIDGLLYAPKGTVIFNVNKLYLNGRIYASGVQFNGSELNVYGNDNFKELIKDDEEIIPPEEIICIYDTKDEYLSGTLSDVSCEDGMLALSGSYEAGEVSDSYSYQGDGIQFDVAINGNIDGNGSFGGIITYQIADEREGTTTYSTYQSHAYMVSPDIKTWVAAKEYCESLGGYLAVVDSDEENEYIRQLIADSAGSTYTAIGYTDEENEGQWRWVNGAVNGYENWNDREPNDGLSLYPHQNYGYMYETGKWDDGEGSEENYYVCEWDDVNDVSNSDINSAILQITVSDREYFNLKDIKVQPMKVTYCTNGSAVLEWLIDTRKTDTIELPIDIGLCNSDRVTDITYSGRLIYAAGGIQNVINLDDIYVETAGYMPSGSWRATYDSGCEGAAWSYIKVNKYLVEDSSVRVYAASSDEVTQLENADMTEVTDTLEGLTGRYIKLYVELVGSSNGHTPIVDSIEIRANTDKESDGNADEYMLTLYGAEEIITGKSVVYNATLLHTGNMPDDLKYIWYIDGEVVEEASSTLEVSYATAGIHNVQVKVLIGEQEYTSSFKTHVQEKEEYTGSLSLNTETPAFNMELDKTSYVAGDDIIVKTNIDDNRLAQYILKLDNTSISVEDLTEFTVRGVGAGNHTIYLLVEDNYGNTFSRQVSVYVYEEMPNITTNFDKDTYYEGDNVKLSVDEAYTIQKVTCQGTEYEVSNHYVNIINPAEGMHSIEMTVVDAQGVEQDVFVYYFVNHKKVDEDISSGTEEPEIEYEGQENEDVVKPIDPSEEDEGSSEDDSDIDPEICPEADISSLYEGQIITEPIDIIGTVGAEGLVGYTLEYSIDGVNYTVFAEGNTAITEGTIGVFDPTMLENGYYTIRLTASGKKYKRQVSVNVCVEGNFKVGNYSVAFRDLDIPVNGVLLGVTRSYDSRRRDFAGDFGYGWRLDVSGGSISTSGVLGEGWHQDEYYGAYGMGKYMLVADRKHEVVINWDNGTVDNFELKLSPESQILYPIEFDISASFKAKDKTTSTLEVVDATTEGLIYLDGMILDGNTLEPFNPTRFKLTKADGTEYIFSLENGVEQIKDINENIIVINRDGITHSDGKSIQFVRNESGYITDIIGDDGRVLSYDYDEQGNLVKVTDYAQKTSEYAYDDGHNITRMINAAGVVASIFEYDEKGRLISITDADGNVVKYDHDIDGRMETVTDKRGYTTVYVYDDRGNVISQTDPYGNSVKYTYDGDNLISVTDESGATTSYTYDENGNIQTVTTADGVKITNTYNKSNYITALNADSDVLMTIEYDRYNRITSTSDQNSNVTDYNYDTRGNLISVSDSIGVYESVTYDKDGNTSSVTNGEGETVWFTYDEYGNCISSRRSVAGVTYETLYIYDGAGNVIQTTDSEGGVIYCLYDVVGNLIRTIDETGIQTEYTYDNLCRLTQISYSDGTSEYFEYDSEGNCISTTDRYGYVKIMSYDRLNRVEKIEYPDGTTENYTYDAVGNVSTFTSCTGGVTSHTYDSMGRRTGSVDALGNTFAYSYDSKSRLSSVTDSAGNTTYYGYDANGNITSITYPDGGVVGYTYDERNRLASETDQNGAVTYYTYDLCDRLTSVTNALGEAYSYTYDEMGNLSTVTDPLGNTTTYIYDSLGQLIETANAVGNSCYMEYDPAGRIISYVDYNGVETSYTYDEYGRIISEKCRDEEILYSYDDYGRLTHVGDTGYTYDSLGRITEVCAGENMTSYEYNSYGAVSRIYTQYSDTRYEYDILGRLVKVSDAEGNITDYSYDACGNLVEARTTDTSGTVLKTSYNYDTCNRLVSQTITDSSDNVLSYYSYTVDAVGNRISVHEEIKGKTVDKTYTYDILGRMTGEEIVYDGKVMVNSYNFDKAGNRSNKVTTSGDVEGTDTVSLTTSYEYNKLNQLVREVDTSDGETIYTYDKNGALILEESDAGTTEYKYNNYGRLIEVVSTVEGLQTITEYTYDVNGNRISMSTNGQVTEFVNDTLSDLTMVLAEISSEKTVVYTYGNDIISMSVDVQYDMDTSCMRYYLTDGHGDVRQLADKWGIVTDEYTYDAYGMLLYHEGDSDNHMLYAGQQYDDSTGLYNMRARYMDPSTGRFLSMDTYQGSIWEPNSLHKYTYTSGNPVMYQDVSGYSASPVPGGIAETGAALAIRNTISTMLMDTLALAVFGNILQDMYIENNIAHKVQVAIAELETDFRNAIDMLSPSQTVNNKICDTVYETEISVFIKYSRRHKNQDDDSEKIEKIGKPKGGTPGNNKNQNKDFDYVAKKFKLGKDERSYLHYLISKKYFDKDEILEIAIDLFNKKGK